MPVDSPSDAELMTRLSQGDVEALGPLYERYRGLVHAVVVRHAGRLAGAESEEVCHEVFLTLIDTAKRYRTDQPLKGWLCGIAMRKASRLRRGSWVRQGLLSRFFRPEEPPPANPDARLDVARVLVRLPPPMRDVVQLSLLEQLSAEDVAQALGIKVNTVWTRLHRAREQIRELFGEGAS